MQHVIDYIRQNAATYSRDMIDAQLRHAGHAEADIHDAWGAAYAAPTPGATAAGVAVMGGGGPAGPIAISGGDVHWFQNPNVRIVLVLLSIVVAVMAGLNAVDEWTDTPERISSRDIVEQVEKSQGSEQAAVTKDALESISGDVGGKLPSGWKLLQDGMWIDYDNGNSLNVITTSREGLTIDQLVLGSVETMKLGGGMKLTGETKVVRFQGRDAHRVQLTQQAADGTPLKTTQLYVPHGDDVTVVTYAVSPEGEDQRDEAVQVAEQVTIPG
jgi:hypothetical protein